VNAITTPPALLDAGAKPARISRGAATALAVALVAVIAWFDYVMGDFSLAVFYLVPVVFLIALVSRKETSTNGATIAGHFFFAKPASLAALTKCIEEFTGG